MRAEAQQYKYSAIIPVYNSQAIVGDTIDQTVAFFEEHNLRYEVVLVIDGSPDDSWQVVAEKARTNPNVVAIDLLRNYGQHTAVYCGLQHATGDYAITLDDDLQNPPSEIAHLIDKALEGYDLVFGQFYSKQHAGYRRAGSKIIAQVNRRIFHYERDLILTNFRIIHRNVVKRMIAYRTNYPYIPGLALMFSSRRANVMVEHRPRPVGTSNYNLLRILRLVMRILFNYSAYPLHFVTTLGIGIAVMSFLLGLYFILRNVFIGVSVPGWTTVVVLLAFFNGITLVIISMLGEYIVRLVNQSSQAQSYYVRDIINGEEQS
jgi:glycosyltransferase involved in cell wall biosynthesis